MGKDVCVNRVRVFTLNSVKLLIETGKYERISQFYVHGSVALSLFPFRSFSFTCNCSGMFLENGVLVVTIKERLAELFFCSLCIDVERLYVR